MVYRVYAEKKDGYCAEADALKNELINIFGITGLKKLRIVNRYDAENIDKDLFSVAVKTVFSEPQTDDVYFDLPDTTGKIFAVEYLPGQFDARADSAEQCIQFISRGNRPIVKTAKIYIVEGDITDADLLAIKKYVINPVEAREASILEKKTLAAEYPLPSEVKTLDGFMDLDDNGLNNFLREYRLAMDFDDIKFCRDYFRNEKRNPTITEIRMIDTYWSDHCRHTTFLTTIDNVVFEDEEIEKAYEEYLAVRKELNRTKPINLMDVATLAAKYLKKIGKLDKLDESDEINACTVKIDVKHDNKVEKWLLLFKNETHNHPTEIEPFGGAATCIGGAIRDPLSGRAYVYGAMRVTGAADPTRPVNETLKGKLPQRKLVTTAAAGYSSYGNQIGLATGQVDEIYHDGYAAKRMEIGAVIAAVPENAVRRECPEPGDKIILLGGRTGRDGCGGATGSSKSHNLQSLETCGAEVQKGNAPEERKLQRLFRNEEAVKLIRRCNDFGAGGVSVAIGELADGLKIYLDKVPKKYEGLDGTELAISESQERMAVAVEEKDVEKFLRLAEKENLEATLVAEVVAEKRLKMEWKGKTIVDISREFLNTNGAEKHANAKIEKGQEYARTNSLPFEKEYEKFASDLNICSKRGLSERFDSTIGAGTVLMPFGGKNQLTPTQVLADKISVEHGNSDTVSLMSWGYNPFIAEKDEYRGAYLAVVESVSKLIAAGGEFKDVYLTFQEYFGRTGNVPERWGKPLSSLLGAFKAQLDLGIASIGGKDSMSGTFENLDVPPTLVSFAVTTTEIQRIISPEFKKANNKVVYFSPEYKNGLPVAESLIEMYHKVSRLIGEKKIISAYTSQYGGIAESIMKMCFGNDLGFEFAENITNDLIFGYSYGTIVAEVEENCMEGEYLGRITDNGRIKRKEEFVKTEKLLSLYENRLEPVYSCNIKTKEENIPSITYKTETKLHSPSHYAKPKVLIPVFPGTNCEYDSVKAFERAGAKTETIVIRNLTKKAVEESVEVFAEKLKSAQMVFIPGGFSGGDEPDGSGKFITAFMRNARVKDEISELLEVRKGLMAGICNGFQALIKLGLVPYGKIVDMDENCPTLTFNTIARHQSMLVRTRVCSNKSPWLMETEVGKVYTVPISHGEGRFVCNNELLEKLIKNGQIATQYVDLNGKPSSLVRFNPNGSIMAIEGITSPDGRVFGKMGHSERIGNGLYKNVEGEYDIKMFTSAVKYFE